MDSLLLDTDVSRMYFVIPVRANAGLSELLAGSSIEQNGFAEIDPDVDLPASFFETLERAPITATTSPTEQPDYTHDLHLGPAELIGVGFKGAVKRWFLVVDLADPDASLRSWLETARMATKAQLSPQICDRFGCTPLASDTRGVVLVSLQLQGSPGTRPLQEVARHLATRAPFDEQLQRTEEAGETQIGENRFRVVTPRVSGFVSAGASGSKYFTEKFPAEMGKQYLLAVVLTSWQLVELNALLNGTSRIWTASAGWTRSGMVSKIRRVHKRFLALELLRDRYASLMASGTFGPVFDSGSQGRFWSELQETSGVHRRRDEVNDALATLAQATETQASLSLERVLAFFTLVIGVPSLAFTVLGVNINRLTSESGLSRSWVMILLSATLVAGALAFIITDGTGAKDDAEDDEGP